METKGGQRRSSTKRRGRGRREEEDAALSERRKYQKGDTIEGRRKKEFRRVENASGRNSGRGEISDSRAILSRIASVSHATLIANVDLGEERRR